MSAIQIYYLAPSPPCRVVEMIANMVGVKLDKRTVNLFAGEHLKEDYLKVNPLHKVPFIVDGDLKMGESRAIIKYLVDKYKPDDALYPKEIKKRAAIDELLFFDIGTLYEAQLVVFRAKVFGGGKVEPEAEKAFLDALRYLDQKINKSGFKFMTGNQLTIADVSIVGTLNYADVLSFDLSEFKNLVAYRQRVEAAIPNYQAINEKPIEQLREFVRSKQGSN